MVKSMNETIIVGKVISINGIKVQALMDTNSNSLTYFYNGKTYKGISIGEYVGIIRGPYKIVGKIEKEYLNDRLGKQEDQTYSLNRFERIIELNIIGYFYNNKFMFGIKYLPLIFNEIVLLNIEEKNSIINYGLNINEEKYIINFGKSLQDDLKINVPINGLFNSHIGIFGNTGSGKSNTLSKLYTELFNNNKLSLINKSKFIFLDFNGEYTGEKMFSERDKKILKLSTRSTNGDKIRILSQNFWDKETLSILFSATEKTQQPFISKMLNYYVKNGDISEEDLKNGIIQAFKDVYEGNNNKECHNLMKKVYIILGLNNTKEIPLFDCAWHSMQSTYYIGNLYLNNVGFEITSYLEKIIILLKNVDFAQINIVDKLCLLINLQFIHYLRYNNVQFEHINPLLTRIEGYKNFINNTIEISDKEYKESFIVISLKNCNLDAKKILPLLISKQIYQNHVNNSKDDEIINNTCHLIIDEAHNILSEQSIRESESFKDYRLEVFEQIIKEGRKYGFYLTISSQRPYDISPTIISQINNYFIHRLVNELDLKMLSNTINTLDSISKDRIPNLAPGQCVITGSIFELPIVLQVDKLDLMHSPNSENADIIKIWQNPEN